MIVVTIRGRAVVTERPGRASADAAVNSIFGSELPGESSDERDPESAQSACDRDDWLRENVPPHHI
ncbi:MAG: hypothetical protein FGM50_01795 [Mycobacterium sp.]|nr:hypothetical protein [Mycobacterium sp.]